MIDKNEWIKGHVQEIADHEADAAVPAGASVPGHQPVTPEHLAAAEADWYNYSALVIEMANFDEPGRGSQRG